MAIMLKCIGRRRHGIMKNNYSLIGIIYRNTYEYFKKARIWALIEQGAFFSRAFILVWRIRVTQYLFEEVISANHGELIASNIIYYLILVGGAMIIEEILSGTSGYLLSKNSYSNMGKFMVDFQAKLGRIKAINFEKADFLDKINRAKECIEYESLGRFTSICLQILGYYLVVIVLTGRYLFQLYPPLILIIIFAFIPSVIGRFIQIKYFKDLEDFDATIRRQADYYKSTIVDRKYFKETRILGGFQFLYQLYKNAVRSMVEKHWKVEKKLFLIQMSLSVISFIGLGIAITLLVNATMNQEISIGAFATVFLALSQIFSLMEELVTDRLNQFGETYVQVANFYRIMDMEEVSTKTEALSIEEGIKTTGISFQYPYGQDLAIDGIDIEIEAGKTYAIVGENGSGKSTLVRLLLGIYSVEQGTINLFGLDTNEILGSSLYRLSSAVFQNFQRYQMTLQDNVWISDMKQLPDTSKVKEALTKSQFVFNDIKLEQMLSPEFGGIDLSGGQWQRVAIARAIHRSYELIMLDEPTAAIDPIEEAHLFNQFRKLTNNKTALIVTHRLASARNADEIIVMEKGKVVEKGTHKQLMALKGIYCHMWHSQEYWYQ